jgi:hypothetical protein
MNTYKPVDVSSTAVRFTTDAWRELCQTTSNAEPGEKVGLWPIFRGDVMTAIGGGNHNATHSLTSYHGVTPVLSPVNVVGAFLRVASVATEHRVIEIFAVTRL